MLKRKCSVLLLFGICFFPFVQVRAQLGQVTSVISIASKYATLLKSNQNDVIYADENLKDEIDDHVKIAIIPFNTSINYIKQPEYTQEDAALLFENQQMVGKFLQEQFWDVFDNYKSEIYLQDIRITNKLLEDIGYFLHPGDFPPSYLAKLLNVDAVLICTYDLEIDNMKTGWQNLSKALSDLAVSQLKGSIPGIQALSFIKNPNALIDAITKPGELFQKLKSGDISAITTIAGSLLPEGNWLKVAEIAAKNSKTISKLAQGDTSNLLSDLVSNNASLLGSELKLNPQVVKLIQNNTKVAQNIIDGNTKGIMFDIISSNVSSITSKYAGEQNTFLTTTLTNNASLIAKLATGDTSNLLQDVLDKNIGQVTSMIGGNNSAFYSNLIINNKDLVSKALKGDFTALTTDLLVNNMSLIGEKLPLGEAQKYAALLSNKEAIKGLLSGNTQSIITSLTQNGLQLFGDQFKNIEVQKLAKLVANNKEFIQSAINGDSKSMITSLLNKDNNILGTALSSSQLGKVGEILNNNSDIILKLASGDTSNLLQEALSNNISSLTGMVANNNTTSFYSDLIIKNKDLLSTAISGDFSNLATQLLSNNASLIGEILPNEDAKKYASFLTNKEAMQSLISGDVQSIASNLTENGLNLFGNNFENVDVQKFATLIGNNKDFIQNAINGDTKNMLSYLVSNNIGLLGENLNTKQSGELSAILLDNKELIGQLVTGNSSINPEELLNNNINRLVGSIGDKSSSFYTKLLLDNKEHITNLTSGNITSLVGLALSTGSELSGNNDIGKYTAILLNKKSVTGLINLNQDQILEQLNNNGEQLFGNDVQTINLQELARFISNNKEFINHINSGNTQQVLTGLLQHNRKLFGIELNFSQINELSQVVGTSTEIIATLFNDNTPTGTLKVWMGNLKLGLDDNALAKASEQLINNKEAITSLLKGDRTQLTNYLGNNEKAAEILIANRSKINPLLGIADDEDFGILNKSSEEIDVLSYKILNNKSMMNGIVKGDQSEMIANFNQEEIKNDIDVSPYLFTQISKGLTAEQKTVAEVIVNSKINQMLLNDMIDLQFFDFGKDALSHKYDNVSLREKTFSQTTASILDPTLDPKDKSKFTINIFGKNDDRVLWQYINENSKTRIYDMSKTVAAVIKRLNKNFPYFNNK